MSKLYSEMKRVPTRPDQKTGKSKVNVTGFVPPHKRIQAMINSGMNLMNAGELAYDIPANTPVDEDNIQPDPTRASGFDLADVTGIAQKVAPSVKAYKKAMAEKDRPLVPSPEVQRASEPVPVPAESGK